jgi:hypothetical protein
MRTVIDNFLPQEEFNLIKNVILGPTFPWSMHDIVAQDKLLCDSKYNNQFVHSFYMSPFVESQHLDLLSSILNKLQPEAIIRIKANIVPCTDKIVEHGFHTDLPGKLEQVCKTAVFYLNTNNGYTLFNDGERVASVENRIAIFDTKDLHTGTSCTDTAFRAVINFNYI